MKPLHERWADEAQMIDDWYAMEKKREVWKNPIECMYRRASKLLQEEEGSSEKLMEQLRVIETMTSERIPAIFYKLAVLSLPTIYFDNILYHKKSDLRDAYQIGLMHGYVQIPALPHPWWSGLQIDQYMKAHVSGMKNAKRDKDFAFNLYESACNSIIERLTNSCKVQPEPKNAK